MGTNGQEQDARPQAKVPEAKIRVEMEVTQEDVLQDSNVQECEAFIGVFFRDEAFGMTIAGWVSRSQIENAYLRLGQYLCEKFDERGLTDED